MTVVRQIAVIDSHTGGEPTRIVISGGPDLGTGTMAEHRALLREQYDWLRSAVVNEPRGSDILVGGLLCPPCEPSCVAGIIFFNNVGYLGMCGHGTIGLIRTLAHLAEKGDCPSLLKGTVPFFGGRLQAGEHRIDTPVGIVSAWLEESGKISVRNVPSYRHLKDVGVEVPGYGHVVGDVAWGGNWFFLVSGISKRGPSPSPQGDGPLFELELQHVEKLTNFTWSIRQALVREGITGKDGQEIDHIELFGPSPRAGVNSRNFVLCPGKAYDRSPCGTGTSAKLACLYADGKLQPGQVWRQESIVGSIFEGSIEVLDGVVYPKIQGEAYVTAEATLILDPSDPFEKGIRA
jgi:4-hydroxyproline epimerase